MIAAFPKAFEYNRLSWHFLNLDITRASFTSLGVHIKIKSAGFNSKDVTFPLIVLVNYTFRESVCYN